MSVETGQGALLVPAQAGPREKIPVYGSGRAPEHLRTRAQLAELRLKPAADAVPVAFVEAEWTQAALFDPAQAVPMRPLNAAAVARRTCPECNQVRQHIVRGGKCHTCREKARLVAERLEARTCSGCRTVRAKPFPDRWARLCRSCKAKRAADRREADARQARVDRACPDCGRRTATTAVIAAHRAEHGNWSWRARRCGPCETEVQRRTRERAVSCPSCGTATTSDAELDAWLAEPTTTYPRNLSGFGRRTCEPCKDRQRQEAEQARQAAVTRRREQLAQLGKWAAEALADRKLRIVDTETTGLHATARIVDIAVLTADGTVLMDTLVNPGVPIPREATAIHGITNADVRAEGVPRFADIVDELAGLLHGHRTLIYNSPYDMRVLEFELGQLHPDNGAAVAGWLRSVNAEDVMMPYSEWVGEIHEYYGDVRWQRLGGNHRAAGDCRAVIECLKAMA